ncbi:hypothetical protein [Arcicella rigui]|uniref:Brp/Blh family beta-carotene 15,15'-monooxygenase n=1 Tax=Arcicella rigui TaxID=797020 RepID=A0ABU5Q583_9BACT|nr:hypothetical protein [Arcicella rigui]MEA5138001.1 hypothetical protein [Arcicella rigui]
MLPNIHAVFIEFNQYLTTHLQKKHWVFVLSFLVFLLFSVIYFPEIVRKRIHNDWTHNDQLMQQFVNNKIENPLKPTLNFAPGEHYRKRDLRITPYIIANVFHLNALRLFYLQLLLLPLFLFFSVSLLVQITKSPPISFWATVALLFSYVGNSFNYDTLFYDSYAYFALLMALYFSGNLFCVFFLLLSYFVDERSLVPSMIIPLFVGLTKYSIETTKENFKTFFQKMIWQNRSFWMVFVSMLVYVLVRVIFYINYHLNTPVGANSGVTIGLAFKYGTKLPYAIYSSLKLNFLLIFCTCFYLFRKQYYFVGLWFLAVFLMSFLVGTAVEDVTRSLAYSYLLVYIVYLISIQIKENISNFIYFIAFVNIFTPTFTLLLNLYKVEAFSWLIHF